jgi:hypothetical protein
MIFFKTRHEVKQLRREIENLHGMLRAHFDIKYTMADFEEWCKANPASKEIPTSVGEFLNFYKMLTPTSRALYYRGIKLKPNNKLKEKSDAKKQ